MANLSGMPLWIKIERERAGNRKDTNTFSDRSNKCQVCTACDMSNLFNCIEGGGTSCDMRYKHISHTGRSSDSH